MRDRNVVFELDLEEEKTRWIFATPDQQARDSLIFMDEVGEFVANRNYYTKRFGLNSFLIKYTVAGEGHLAYNNQTYAVKPNQLFWIDCNPTQYYRTSETVGNWHIFWVVFRGATSREYYELFKSLNNGSPVVSLPPDHVVHQHIAALIELYSRKDPSLSTDIYASGCLTQILVEIIQAAIHDKQCLGVPKYVTQIQDHLAENYMERITLDDLSQMFSVSKFHLQKQFKFHTGYTPNEYLTKIRLTRAKAFLRTTRNPVSQIACDVGMENISHFITQFKKQEGLTPNNFRKKLNPF